MEVSPWRGDLHITVECRTERDAKSRVRHAIVLSENGVVATPHDLQAERVAAAFGAYCSCLDLVDDVLPKLLPVLGRVTRQTTPTLRRDAQDTWRVPNEELAACCSTRGFRSVGMVAEHLRSPSHLAAVLDLPLWQVDEIVRQVGKAARPTLDASSPSAKYLQDERDLTKLWRAGIHPDRLPALAELAAPVKGALPTTYFEGVVYSGHSPLWLNDMLTHRPDPDIAGWLAWRTPPDTLNAPRDLGLWLTYGLSRSDIEFAIEAMLPTDSIPAVAEATGWSTQASARVLLAFAKMNCFPTPEQLVPIAGLQLQHALPGKSAVDAAVDDMRRIGVSLDRTELAVMLALVGNRPTLTAEVRGGARSVAQLAILSSGVSA